MTEKSIIEERTDGPLVVKHPKALKNSEGTDIELREVLALCRCGRSSNKPFCDGSHNEVGFSSARPDVSKRDRVFIYEGRDTTVYYNRLLCSHAGECSARLQAVFDPGRKPWIEPDSGTVEDIEDVVKACPSGALRFAVDGGDPRHLVDGDHMIEIEKNGPYRVRNVEIENAPTATGASDRKFVLCRCGQSGNKPFCDGTHYDVNWRDDRD